MKIALIEPYYGGSHKAFWDLLAKVLPYDFELYTLPARKWKWRMRLAAPLFAQLIGRKSSQLADLSCFLCSPFLDVATFKGLLPSPLNDKPVLTYFHENQFAYPVQAEDERDFHFALTNVSTALASDRIAFNSQYNFDSFLQGADKLLGMIYDMKLADWRSNIVTKSTILYPGLDFTDLDAASPLKKHPIPTILWNHRWEHDKNPELFFNSLEALKNRGLRFKLVVAGESFQRIPEIFIEAKKQFQGETIQFGYIKSRQDYLSMLKSCDIVVSTALHEFYGISIIEAVRAGCRPLLPARLSYPELFPKKFIYKDGELVRKLTALLKESDFSKEEGKRLTEKFSFETLKEDYQRWFKDNPPL